MIRLLALAMLALAQPASSADEGDCLFAGPSSPEPAGCSDDPYRIAQQPLIVAGVEHLGVAADRIAFRGCARGRFSTRMPEPGRYVVSYPVSADYDFRTYVGPLTHELGHVAQLREAGSLAALRASLRHDSARVELGADFIAGFMFRRYMNSLDQAAFEQSLDLLGNYASGPRASHSRPEARTSAFRMGFYYAAADIPAIAAHRDFQRNRFGGIMHEIMP